MRIALIITVLTLVLIPSLTFGEELPDPYSFGTVTVRIDGWAKENFILGFLAFDSEKTFADVEALEEYLLKKKQQLVNKRLFREADITYSISEEDEYKADVEIYVKDGAPVFFLPYYKYNSNYGHQFGCAVYLYDVFGTLTNLMIGGGYSATSFDDDPHKKVDWDLNIEWDKIEFFNYTWDLNFRHRYMTTELINYSTDEYEQFYKNYETSLTFSTGTRLFEYFSYSFKPSFKWNYGYHVVDGDVDTSTKLISGLSHGLGYRKLNWTGNTRTGYSAGLGQGIGYDFFENKVNNELNIEYKAFYPWWIFQLSTAGKIHYNLMRDSIGTADKLRGILNSRTSGQFVFTENFDISTKLFTVPKVMDVRGGSFLDVGVMKRQDRAVQFPYFSAGIEGLFFPIAYKSLVIRGTFGMDLRALAEGKLNKWELEISQHLFY